MQAACYAFRGSPADVAGRVYALPQEIVSRDFYALLLQGAESAGIHVFTRERSGDDEGSVAVWSGATLNGLPEQVLALVLGQKSGLALRKKVVDVLRAHGELADLGTVPCPPTPRGAFGHPLRPYARNTELRVVVAAL